MGLGLTVTVSFTVTNNSINEGYDIGSLSFDSKLCYSTPEVDSCSNLSSIGEETTDINYDEKLKVGKSKKVVLDAEIPKNAKKLYIKLDFYDEDYNQIIIYSDNTEFKK